MAAKTQKQGVLSYFVLSEPAEECRLNCTELKICISRNPNMPSEYINARNPFTGQSDYRFEITSAEEIKQACIELKMAQPKWQALGITGRIAALRELGEVFTQEKLALFKALSTDTGRQRITHVEIQAMQSIITTSIKNALVVFQEAYWCSTPIPSIFGQQQYLPYPLVGIIAPWNFPLVLSMIDSIPALLAGCAVVLKPSEITPRYIDPLKKIFSLVPEIAAVTRIIRGPGSTGAALMEHIDAVVCTGSVSTGRIVAEHAARRFIPAFLELGGKDAVIITEDADLSRAANTVVRSSITATGQACQSLERVYVARSVHNNFLNLLRTRITDVKITAYDPHGHIGPFIMARQAEIVRDHIMDALAKGAKLEAGGNIIERGGLWCEPTLLSQVDHSMRIMNEETFGPVIPVMAFDTLNAAINLANETDYGLSANVFAGSEEEALSIARKLEAGFISINDISMSSYVSDFEWEGFGFSGLGRSRMGTAGIARYLKTKAIVVNRGSTNKITDLPDT